MIEMQSIYLAAPLFSQAEQNFNWRLYEFLTSEGYAVFLPQKECEHKRGKEIYETCLAGLRAAAVVVAILDGADADSGTCWECGYAVGCGIPTIAVRTDIRESGDTRGFNAMLYYSAAIAIETGQSLHQQIAAAIQHILQPD